MRRTLLAILATTLVVATLSGTAVAQTASGSHQLRPRAIIIDNDAYYPASLRVMPGQTVTVTNAEGEPHSLTARNGSFDTGIYETGNRLITAPSQPGSYWYSCLVHGPAVMKGVLIVGS